MTRNDIRQAYTQKVSELLAKGYQIHYETMNGSQQGELAHIDLTDGNEVLRVLLERGLGFGYGKGTKLRVGRCTEDISGTQTIWNYRPLTLFEIEWDQINENFYTTFEEGMRMAAVKRARLRRRRRNAPLELGEAYKSVVLRWLRRQPGMESCQVEDITRMTKHTPVGGKVSYQIIARGKTFILRA